MKHASRKTLSRRQWLVIGSAVAFVVGLLFFAAMTLVFTSVFGTSAGTVTESAAVPSTTVTTAGSTAVTVATTAASSDNSTTAAAEATTTAQAVVTTDGHYVQPAGYDWNLRLVNTWNRMSAEDSNSLNTEDIDGEECDARIYSALRAMLDAGSAYGLAVTSGYRSYSLQEELFENKIGRVQAATGYDYDEAAEVAATEVARPGTSEHNTGLAVDLVNSECYDLEEYWEDTAAFGWLQEHCADYGFILRFPRGKQEYTGIVYEPWHYRYVGVEAATEIMSRGLCLEEYLAERGA
ncbi:MAG: M15 family metallopeptidase [Clostridia bacterium]|nr:M15 family metallopeptidase [Clostridia bacterium]